MIRQEQTALIGPLKSEIGVLTFNNTDFRIDGWKGGVIVRKVRTISICLPEKVAEYTRAEADRLGISVSAYISMCISERAYQQQKTQIAALYGLTCREGE